MKKSAPQLFNSSVSNPNGLDSKALDTGKNNSQSSDRRSLSDDAFTSNSNSPKLSSKVPVEGNSGERSLVDLEKEPFNLGDKELTTTWSSHAQIVCCLNAYPNGLTLSLHDKLNASSTQAGNSEQIGARDVEQSNVQQLFPSQFHLRFRDTRDYQVPTGKYFLHKENFKASLEKHLLGLQKKGLLSSTTIYFGTVTDPFMTFAKKFPVTMACLEVLEQYRPANLVVQTRSPMVIAALPTLKYLAQNCVVVMPIETKLEAAVTRYMPGQPKISERLVAAQGLRQQGITVNLAASPLLPYGHITRNAWEFAAMLVRNADYVTFGSLASGVVNEEAQLKNLPISKKLVADGQEVWLRPHCYRYLYSAVKVLAPEKLKLPVQMSRSGSQLDLFAA